ncbi:MAG: 2-oxo acid dehydrogenase subunit E2 [Opitutales bacterium]
MAGRAPTSGCCTTAKARSNRRQLVSQTVKAAISGDHREIGGTVGAQYLKALKQILETPAFMLL